MAITFTVSDLLLSQERLDEITAALANSEHEAPLEDIIAEAIDKVDSYTGRYEIAESRYKRLVRAVVMFEIHASGATGGLPTEIESNYNEAQTELKDIRDGKFPDLALKAAAPTGTPTGEWGSEDKI